MVVTLLCHSEEHRDEESVSPYLRFGERILRLRFTLNQGMIAPGNHEYF